MAGLPMIYDVTPLHHGEPARAIEMIEREWDKAIKPHLPQNGKLPVFDADGGFHSHKLRKLIHEVGGVPRIHHRSHSDHEKSKRAVAADRKARWKIDGYPMWQANGLREIFCNCGQGRTFRRFSKTKSGQAVARVEGSCKTCGPISVTAWRLAPRPESQALRQMRLSGRPRAGRLGLWQSALVWRLNSRSLWSQALRHHRGLPRNDGAAFLADQGQALDPPSLASQA